MALLALTGPSKVDRDLIRAVGTVGRVLQDMGGELASATCRDSRGRRVVVVVYRYWGSVFWLN